MVLLFLARADGTMRKNEREIIGQYVKNLLSVSSESALADEIKSWKCEFAQFGKSLKAMKEKSLDLKKSVFESAKAIYELKKTPDPMETAAYQKIQETLNK